jgi:hypothetical protein
VSNLGAGGEEGPLTILGKCVTGRLRLIPVRPVSVKRRSSRHVGAPTSPHSNSPSCDRTSIRTVAVCNPRPYPLSVLRKPVR